MSTTQPYYASLGQLGFAATESMSGFDYAKWVSRDGNLIVGSLPDDGMPNLLEFGDHRCDGRLWMCMTLDQFARMD